MALCHTARICTAHRMYNARTRMPPSPDMLLKRGKDMSDKISANLWNEELGIFVNRFSSDHNNGTFYEHISPTSFYALQAKAATDAQAATMAEKWLMNSSRFCIAENGDFKGNKDTCYWGLPSIEASDPAYPPLGYWRGYATSATAPRSIMRLRSRTVAGCAVPFLAVVFRPPPEKAALLPTCFVLLC